MTVGAFFCALGVVLCLGIAFNEDEERHAWLTAATWAFVAFLFAIGWI